MRQVLGLLLLAVLVPILHGVLLRGLPGALCPQLGVLLVLGLGLVWSNVLGGILVAALAGIASDQLSGSLAGQLVLLHVGAYLSARYASGHLDLGGPLPIAIFAAGFTVLYGLAMLLSTHFFLPEAQLGWSDLRVLARVVVLNGLFAPWIVRGLRALLAWLEAPEVGRRRVFLGPRRGFP